jgi:hypothetical protein
MRKLALAVLLPGALAAGCSRPAAEPAQRDLTLLTAADSSATAAIASARELDRVDPEPRTRAEAGVTLRPRPVPVRAHAKPAAPAPEASAPAPVAAPAPTPAAKHAPAPPPAPATLAARGAGTPLEPGQSVTLVPAGATAGPGQVPGTELLTAQEMGHRSIIIIGDDRCVPGRGELLPGLRLRHWRH